MVNRMYFFYPNTVTCSDYLIRENERNRPIHCTAPYDIFTPYRSESNAPRTKKTDMNNTNMC